MDVALLRVGNVFTATTKQMSEGLCPQLRSVSALISWLTHDYGAKPLHIFICACLLAIRQQPARNALDVSCLGNCRVHRVIRTLAATLEHFWILRSR